jgi:acetyltransferase-like isoleucine patch superfamily enzyme
VIIHDNVWIGLNTVVLKGVEIGENAVIGANSLVTNSIPANVIAGGNPCKVLKIKKE